VEAAQVAVADGLFVATFPEKVFFGLFWTFPEKVGNF
jgi:hypothetical protein